jgi:hypothetical protein
MVPGITVLGDDRELQSGLKGWWSKLEIFAPWNDDLRPCLFIDLDTYILDLTVLSEFSELQDGLWLLNDFNRPHMPESGIFVAPRDGDSIWQGAGRAQQAHRGDGPYLGTFPHKRLQPVIAGIRSYKVDQLYDSPKDARIVCFHGKPKPHDTEGWAAQYWTTLTSPTNN